MSKTRKSKKFRRDQSHVRLKPYKRKERNGNKHRESIVKGDQDDR